MLEQENKTSGVQTTLSLQWLPYQTIKAGKGEKNMTCMYCGNKTRNENRVCDDCQTEAERMAQQFQKEVHEVCPNCGNEIHAFVLEGIESIDVCPYCGERNVFLCSECMEEIGDCQPNASCAYCHGHPNIYKEEE